MIFQHYLGKKVQLGVTGSIAAYKSLELLRKLTKSNVEVGVTLTKAGAEFVPALNFDALGANVIFQEEDFFSSDFPHLYPQKEKHCFVICPCSANTLAKISLGLADNLLTTQILAFSGPIIIAPAMNTKMWENPLTQEHLQRLKQQGQIIIEPDAGQMACGDTGKGRLPDIDFIYFYVLRAISPQDMQGLKVLITAGPTREYFDLVRFWSNPSSGKTGQALALVAWLRGAEVHLVRGPVSGHIMEQLPGLKVYPITTAREMLQISLELWSDMQIGICSAAVCDFRPQEVGNIKMKKANQEHLQITFLPNPDILLELGKRKTKIQKLAGFALEAKNLEQQARTKLERKRLDLIIGNVIGDTQPFGQDENTVFVLDKTGKQEQWPKLAKTEIAWRIWDILLSL
ncbi:MAG: bifunctional phosphopantothenoylcysteine decarboxylase/phosphopantothenate--cysteine ligase CoaBC [Desulfonauticus sp.]|nr:bifunctional phosphopantothenoylcysteine decarboxylase/phosphopantothenate--cysteine ligase CoaBC [Desulfonauticus sp.]